MLSKREANLRYNIFRNNIRIFVCETRCSGSPFPLPLPGINDKPECMPGGGGESENLERADDGEDHSIWNNMGGGADDDQDHSIWNNMGGDSPGEADVDLRLVRGNTLQSFKMQKLKEIELNKKKNAKKFLPNFERKDQCQFTMMLKHNYSIPN